VLFAADEPPVVPDIAAPVETVIPDAEAIPPSPLVRRILDDPYTSDAEKRRIRLTHGRWDEVDDLSPAEAALVALQRYDLDALPAADEAIPALLRARAAIGRGDPATALALLQGDDSAEAHHWRAVALLDLGRADEAVALLEPWRDRLQKEAFTDAGELTFATRNLVTLARLQGRPSADYHLAIRLLGQARGELDPLDPRPRLAEAQLLNEKDNRNDAGAAFVETLSLDPKHGEAWYGLGRLHAEGFNFDKAQEAVDKLRAVNADHPLAALLEAFILLRQRDVAGARAALAPLLQRYPDHRGAIALLAACEALAYDDGAMRAALDRYEALCPGSAEPYVVVGEVLSLARQYPEAEAMLREAVKREPNWSLPHTELGLLLMQAAELPAARVALDNAARIDHFNVRATNQLKLVEELIGYERIETDHFIISYQKGPDAALARDMPVELERFYRDVTAAFQHQPPRKTQIDVMPNMSKFAVRIVGTPDIWTIAASTGDAIAMTPPKEGPDQYGPFDWVNVLRHEFVHTVNLSQTRNRVPHWFAEAAAVSQELVPRDYDTCQLLAWALREDKLFGYRDINWGFVRPTEPYSRQLAYAQANWMFEYLVQRFGYDAIVRLLALYGEGVADEPALTRVTSLNAEQFMTDFRAWAHREVEAWGLGEQETPALSTTATLDELRLLHAQHPDHADLLKLLAERTLAAGEADEARRLILRYAAVRPVDPWPHREMAALALKQGWQSEAIAALEQLDRVEAHSGAWADELARMHRAAGGAGELDRAAASIARAIRREPYNADYRTTAATIALQRGDTGAAMHELRALADLEPDRAVHFVRLAAMHAKLGDTDAARAAAERARALDPQADVGRFLK